MGRTVLSFKGGPRELLGGHDSSIAIVSDGEIRFAAETERFTRNKHGDFAFPSKSIRVGLRFSELELEDVDTVVVPYEPELETERLTSFIEHFSSQTADEQLNASEKEAGIDWTVDHYKKFSQSLVETTEEQLAEMTETVPEVRTREHHRCHAASAFHPSGFDDALVLSIDQIGEIESTVVWHGDSDGLGRVRSYEYPNSLGTFYTVVTKMLGFRPTYDEGKIMGLAAYGEPNEEVTVAFDEVIDAGVDYDVTELTAGLSNTFGVARLEELFGRERNEDARDGLTQWDKNVAYAAQQFLEETVTDIVSHYCDRLDVNKVALSGGVALNCKMSKAVRELPCVDELFVQPAANDAGLALGAGLLEFDGDDVPTLQSAYHGPEFSTAYCERELKKRKISYSKPENLNRTVAKKLADGALVGWYQGRMEFGPRALGHRSILADPRDGRTRDQVNEFVKHREEWRPFAPSMLADAADEYLQDSSPAPFMVQTFDVRPEKRHEMQAVLHPGDDTTRPQTVREDVNPRYYGVIREFERITGVPMVLNTSFNDSGEPIVNRPKEAITDFYNMGLDVLVLNDCLIEK
jgi:carbamoyltransferase